MFVINPDLSYDWPVRVEVPNEGTFEEQTFTATFKALAQERLDAFISADKLDLLLLREVFVGWRGVTQADGAELAFSEEARETMLGIPYVLLALARAYTDSIAGGRYRAKNLQTPPATGPGAVH